MSASSEHDPSAPLIAQLYDELRALAHKHISRERPGQTLQTTALVHEVFLRVSGSFSESSNLSGDRSPAQQFYQAAAVAMRRILIERARARGRMKRGGGFQRRLLEDAEISSHEDSVDWLALDAALCKLEAHDRDLAELVGLRYFAGLSVDQAAAALGVSARTVDRNWRLARAFLQRHLMADE